MPFATKLGAFAANVALLAVPNALALSPQLTIVADLPAPCIVMWGLLYGIVTFSLQ
jgi:hypothetical protein